VRTRACGGGVAGAARARRCAGDLRFGLRHLRSELLLKVAHLLLVVAASIVLEAGVFLLAILRAAVVCHEVRRLHAHAHAPAARGRLRRGSRDVGVVVHGQVCAVRERVVSRAAGGVNEA
jgi:hypothetical protein